MIGNIQIYTWLMFLWSPQLLTHSGPIDLTLPTIKSMGCVWTCSWSQLIFSLYPTLSSINTVLSFLITLHPHLSILISTALIFFEHVDHNRLIWTPTQSIYSEALTNLIQKPPHSAKKSNKTTRSNTI